MSLFIPAFVAVKGVLTEGANVSKVSFLALNSAPVSNVEMPSAIEKILLNGGSNVQNVVSVISHWSQIS